MCSLFSFISCPSGHGFSGERLAKPRQLFVLMLFGFEVTNTFTLSKDKDLLLKEHIAKDRVLLLREHIQLKLVKDKVSHVAGGPVGDRPVGAARPCREDLPGGGHRQP